MFKLDPDPTFNRTVEVLVPTDGGHRKDTLEATFRAIDTDLANSFDLRSEESTSAFLREIVVRLDDIADGDGKPMPYSDALRDQVLAKQYVRVALCRAFFEAMSGAKRGN